MLLIVSLLVFIGFFARVYYVDQYEAKQEERDYKKQLELRAKHKANVARIMAIPKVTTQTKTMDIQFDQNKHIGDVVNNLVNSAK